MKAADFIYHRASSVAEVVQLLDDYGGGARVLAGGQSLVAMLNTRIMRPAALIDINGLSGLAHVEARGEETAVGALVRYHTIETDPTIAVRLPLLAHMVGYIGDRQVRNRGTIGGSLVQGDPSAEMPLACLVLGATVHLRGPTGVRQVAMRDFYEGAYAAALAPDELLEEIVFPRHPGRFAFHEINRRHNDFAVLSVVATGDRGADGGWSDVRIGLGSAGVTPIRVFEAEPLLDGTRLEEATIARAAEVAVAASSPVSDMRAGEEYRRHLVSVYVPRVLRELRDTDETEARRGARL